MQQPRPWVIVPGIWNSDPEHWQSRWQAERSRTDGRVARIRPSSWSDPDPADWDAAVSRVVDASDEPPVLIAHSLGVLAAAAWLSGTPDAPARVAGAFLVAPPDPDAHTFPEAARGFRAPDAPALVPTALVVSDDDPYCDAERAVGFARTLGSAVLRVGAAGHVNVASGLGDWQSGRALLDAFERSI